MPPPGAAHHPDERIALLDRRLLIRGVAGAGEPGDQRRDVPRFEERGIDLHSGQARVLVAKLPRGSQLMTLKPVEAVWEGRRRWRSTPPSRSTGRPG